MGDTCVGAGGELPAAPTSMQRDGAARAARPSGSVRSHLPVNVLLYEAGALTDVEALQQSYGREEAASLHPPPALSPTNRARVWAQPPSLSPRERGRLAMLGLLPHHTPAL